MLDPDNPFKSRTTSFSAADVPGGVYLWLDWSFSFFSLTKEPREITLEYVEYYEDGFIFARRFEHFAWDPDWSVGWSWKLIGQRSSEPWAPGHYRVYVYDGDRKVAEVQYEVTE